MTRSNRNSGKIPKGSGNSWKVTSRRRYLLHLQGIMNIVSETPFTPHIPCGSRSGCYFWTYSKYPLGISGVPSPNLIHSSFHINLKRTKIQLHNKLKHFEALLFIFNSILRHWSTIYFFQSICDWVSYHDYLWMSHHVICCLQLLNQNS